MLLYVTVGSDPIPAPTAFGSAATFTTTNSPKHLAVDDAGIVYASDGANLATSEIDRYDLDTSSFLPSVSAAPFVPPTFVVFNSGGISAIVVLLP